MAALRFSQVDVFTKVPFGGNPVAVVLDAAGLDSARMQRIAHWTNLSETTFVLPPDDDAADYRLRIFTPSAELPFAGHPTLGSAHAVIEAGIVTPKSGRLRQACGAGTIEIAIEEDAAARLWLQAPASTDAPLADRHRDALERSLGAAAVRTPRVIHVGPVWLVADLGESAAVDALRPDMAALADFSRAAGVGGVTVFGATGAPPDGSACMHVRSFAPLHGIAEDPVCGSGNISVAAYLQAAGEGARFGQRYEARQGMQLGRDGRVMLRYAADGAIWLGGNAVTCISGTLQV